MQGVSLDAGCVKCVSARRGAALVSEATAGGGSGAVGGKVAAAASPKLLRRRGSTSTIRPGGARWTPEVAARAAEAATKQQHVRAIDELGHAAASEV